MNLCFGIELMILSRFLFLPEAQCFKVLARETSSFYTQQKEMTSHMFIVLLLSTAVI